MESRFWVSRFHRGQFVRVDAKSYEDACEKAAEWSKSCSNGISHVREQEDFSVTFFRGNLMWMASLEEKYDNSKVGTEYPAKYR